MLKVLYIEDDVGHLALVSRMLAARGFEVETAEEGLGGVEKARKSRPDIILLDLMLPHLDGFGVMRALAEHDSTRQIPIVVISAWPTADNRKRVREAGAHGFIAKPFQAEDLINLVFRVLPSANAEMAETGEDPNVGPEPTGD